MTQAIGGQQAEVAGAGFASSGSALDLLRDSDSQGALGKAVLQQQGVITEAGYTEEANSYTRMSQAANYAVQGDQLAAKAEDQQATGADWAAALKGISAVATLLTPRSPAAAASGASGGKGGG